MSAASLPPSPGVAVLADAALWRRIAMSVSGWSFSLHRFHRDVMPRHLRDKSKPSSGYYFDGEQFPLFSGALLHVALAEDNLRMLKIAYEARKSLAGDDKELELLDTSRVTACAVHYGRLDALDWIADMLATEPEWWTAELDLTRTPLLRGDVVMLELLVTRFPSVSATVHFRDLKDVVERNDTATIQWAYDRGYDFTGHRNHQFLMDGAVSLKMLEVIHSGQRVLSCSTRAMDSAAARGDLSMVRFLHAHRSEGCTYAALVAAAALGSLDVVRYLHEHGLVHQGSAHAMDGAAARGHCEIVWYLHKHRTEGCSTAAIDGAAKRGYLEIVRFLHEHRTEGCTTKAMDHAAKNGHLEVVKYLHEHRTEGCTTVAMDSAAENGHVEIVRFLHEHRREGCTTKALHSAVDNKHNDIVRMLSEERTEGAMPRSIDAVAACGNLETVQLLVANWQRNKRSVHLKSAMNVAARSGHLDVVRFLDEVSVKSGEDVLDRVASRDDSSKNGGEIRVDCTSMAMDLAAVNGHVDVVRFLHDHRNEGCTFRALQGAAARGYVSVVAFLLANRPLECGDELAMAAALRKALARGHEAVVMVLREHLHEWVVFE